LLQLESKNTMAKTLNSLLKFSIPAILVLAVSSPFINYGMRQKLSEYRTLHTAHRILADIGQPELDLALIMAIVKKESSFWPSAIGRGNEVGLMQLHYTVAEEAGLTTVGDILPRSTQLEKLLFTDPSDEFIESDNRFEPETNLRVGISYLAQLYRSFKRNYNLSEKDALDFATISYNFGIGNVTKLFRLGYSQNPQEFIARLSTENLTSHGISERKRKVVVDYFVRVNGYEDEFSRKIPKMLARESPSVPEFTEQIFNSFPEIYRRTIN